MIAAVIRWSVAHRLTVLLATAVLAAAGLWSLQSLPIDALPELSEVQVIIRTPYPGQAPQLVENLVTYPLSTALLSTPGAKTVRGVSLFGDSFVQVLFDDGVDMYWARSRVLELLSQVQGRLPAAAKPALGPDATGVGWIFQYALVDRSGKHDLSQLRALQDWFLKYALKSLPDVAEVASLGGMVRQYQVQPDPARLAAYGLTYGQVREALAAGNQEAGGAVLVLGEAETMVRASGSLKTLADFRAIPLLAKGGVAVTLGDVASVQLGPEMRRGVAELDGEGEVAGGVVILRSGKNAQATIAGVKAKLVELQKSLPPGVEVVTTYDRSGLIDRAVQNLSHKLLEEFAVVAAVCGLFLWHARSALVAIIALPLGVLAALAAMRWQGLNANIMSLGGIAIAVGAMVDAAVVMIENAHKKLEGWQREHPGQTLAGGERRQVITMAATEVGPALFISLLIITLSFIPVFALQAQEGRLFGPLAATKSYAMAGAAALSVTLVPVLMVYWIRGRIPDERRNPLCRVLIGAYRPTLDAVLRWPKATLLMAALVLASTAWPLSQLGSEFLPMLDEGDLLYMPTALPGLSTQKAAELLQITDRLIKTVPEVARVFGKAGRAETATDPAPMEMFETTITLKPRDQWRAGLTPRGLIEALDQAVQVPGLSNLWVPPIRNRIDMLATGIKSPIGVRISGPDLAALDRVAAQVALVAKAVPGVSSALAERQGGGRYLDVKIQRQAAARHGLNIAELQTLVAGALGGETVTEVIDGRARFPVNLRYPRELRDSPERLAALPIVTPGGALITLGSVATLTLSEGPTMLKSENAQTVAWVYVDVRGRDLGTVAQDLRRTLARRVTLEPGVTLDYAGQFEHLARANARLSWVAPVTLLIIFGLLTLCFGRVEEAALIMLTLPLALTGGVWFLYAMGYALSVATGVGFIALAGVAAEFGVVMLIYLHRALQERLASGAPLSAELVDAAIRDGAVARVRPKAMTVAVILAGLAPIVWGSGTGAELMSRIAAPMLGGMLSAPLLSLLVLPAVVALRWRAKR